MKVLFNSFWSQWVLKLISEIKNENFCNKNNKFLILKIFIINIGEKPPGLWFFWTDEKCFFECFS